MKKYKAIENFSVFNESESQTFEKGMIYEEKDLMPFKIEWLIAKGCLQSWEDNPKPVFKIGDKVVGKND